MGRGDQPATGPVSRGGLLRAFVDVINTMSDRNPAFDGAEFEEWGNPKLPDQYQWLRAYCPYTNLERKHYPAILVRTSFNDSQVMYWEPAKYVARLRTMNRTPTRCYSTSTWRPGMGVLGPIRQIQRDRV